MRVSYRNSIVIVIKVSLVKVDNFLHLRQQQHSLSFLDNSPPFNRGRNRSRLLKENRISSPFCGRAFHRKTCFTWISIKNLLPIALSPLERYQRTWGQLAAGAAVGSSLCDQALSPRRCNVWYPLRGAFLGCFARSAVILFCIATNIEKWMVVQSVGRVLLSSFSVALKELHKSKWSATIFRNKVYFVCAPYKETSFGFSSLPSSLLWLKLYCRRPLLLLWVRFSNPTRCLYRSVKSFIAARIAKGGVCKRN